MAPSESRSRSRRGAGETAQPDATRGTRDPAHRRGETPRRVSCRRELPRRPRSAHPCGEPDSRTDRGPSALSGQGARRAATPRERAPRLLGPRDPGARGVDPRARAIVARVQSPARARSPDDVETAHVRTQRPGYPDGAILLLVILNDCDHRARERETGAIQRVYKID